MRVLIAVTHLLGAGHLTRAAALARALSAAGHETVLVSGGAPASLVRFDGVRLVQLPPLRVRGTAFGTLLNADGSEAEAKLFDCRRKTLLATLEETAPDAIVTELFPFGRRGLAEEYLALIEAARARIPRPLILASVRDILVEPDKPSKVAQAHDRLARFYDAVLVHGDPDLVFLDASWPVDEGLRPALRYTGYVDEGGARIEAWRRNGIVVAAGSSAVGLGLFHVAAEAARSRPDLGWRILAGHGVAESDFAAVAKGLPEGVVVRAQPDYRTQLSCAAVSVSECGYNTAIDLLAAGPRALLVPFEAGRETEQRLRAERLAARDSGGFLEDGLDADTLLEAIDAASSEPLPAKHGIDLNGAARSVAIIEDMVRSPPRRQPSVRDFRFDRLLAALDTAGAKGTRVPVWWRDDDAIAASPSLNRLLRLAESNAAPILIAAIPAAIEPSLGERIERVNRAFFGVHGLAHANHAAAGKKPSEFDPHRGFTTLVAEAALGLRLARERLPEDRLLPVFIPPWNRLAPVLAEALPGLGYLGLSAAAGPDVAGLIRADIHFDPIDWRGTRSLVEPSKLLDGLTRSITENPGRPIGLLTHHLAHDEAIWAFLAEFLQVLFAHPAVTIRDPADLFRAEPMDAFAPPCVIQDLERLPRVN